MKNINNDIYNNDYLTNGRSWLLYHVMTVVIKVILSPSVNNADPWNSGIV